MQALTEKLENIRLTVFTLPRDHKQVWDIVCNTLIRRPPKKLPRIEDHRPLKVVEPLIKPNYIQKLPPELLLEVFMMFLNNEEERDVDHSIRKPSLSSRLYTSAEPFTLLAVCRRWRSMKEQASMWSSLAVYKPRRDHIPTIFSWLECARQSPLSLYLHAPAGDNFEDQRAIAYILGFFLDSQRERQIKHITLKLAGEFPISVSPFFGSSTPRLKSVELDLHGPQDTMHVWRAFCNVGIPQVWWRPSGVLHTLPSMPWEALTRLRLPIATNEAGVSMTDLMKALLYCDRLVDLEIAMKMPLVDTFPSSNSPYTTEQYAGALLCLREYRKRTLPSEEYVMDSASLEMALSGPIDLPRLRHFKVQAHGRDSTPLLNRLSARNLTSLRIAHFNKDESTSPSTMDGIISLLERSQAQLTSLSIFDSKMPKSETVKLISCPQVVGLRSLELLIGPVGHSVLHPLTFTRKKRCMPGLRKLVLPGCIVKQGFLSGMLKSRRTTLQELTFTTARVTKELYQELSDMRRIAAESRVLLTID